MSPLRGREQANLSVVAALLERVDDLPSGATGTLLVAAAGRPAGAIFVDDRQVCWVAAQGLGRRLTDLLREAGRLSEGIDEVVQHCRVTGEPIGQALVDRGLVDEPALERALLLHSAESLLALGRGGASLTWAPRTSGFATRHRMTTATLLAAAGASAWGATAPPSTGWAEDVGAAVAVYARGGGGLALVAERGASGRRTRLLVELGKYVAGLLDVTAAIDERRRCVTVREAAGGHLVTWVDGGLIVVALCPDVRVMSRVLSKILVEG